MTYGLDQHNSASATTLSRKAVCPEYLPIMEDLRSVFVSDQRQARVEEVLHLSHLLPGIMVIQQLQREGRRRPKSTWAGNEDCYEIVKSFAGR